MYVLQCICVYLSDLRPIPVYDKILKVTCLKYSIEKKSTKNTKHRKVITLGVEFFRRAVCI